MITVDYKEFLKWPEHYLLKGLTDGVFVTRNGHPYVNITKPDSLDMEDFIKKYKGSLKIEDLDLDDPFIQKYLSL